jgi:hypothetical protein
VPTAAAFTIETGLPKPDIKGGQPRKPSPIRDAVQELIAKGVPTPDGEASAVWFPGVTEKTLPVRSALLALQKAGAEFNVTVIRHWELASRGTGRNKVEGSQIAFYVVERMPSPRKIVEDRKRKARRPG